MTSPPDNPNMPGIRDFQATIPFRRTGPDGTEQETSMLVRVPAFSDTGAIMLAAEVAGHVSMANKPTDGMAWSADQKNITVVDVDGTPSADELAVERDYWKRVVAGLAERYPMMIHLTPEQYAGAHPEGLQVMPFGNGMMFLVPSALPVVPPLPPEQAVGQEPVLLPGFDLSLPAHIQTPPSEPDQEVYIDGEWMLVASTDTEDAPPGKTVLVVRRRGAAHAENVAVDSAVQLQVREAQPAYYGDWDDPSVRQVRIRNLPAFGVGAAELLHEGEWVTVVGVNVAGDGSITARVGTSNIAGPAHLDIVYIGTTGTVTVRPATVEGCGSDLPSAALHHRQVLAGDGWWTVARCDYTGPFADTYNITLERDGARRDTSVTAREDLLLRDKPGKGWS